MVQLGYVAPRRAVYTSQLIADPTRVSRRRDCTFSASHLELSFSLIALRCMCLYNFNAVLAGPLSDLCAV